MKIDMPRLKTDMKNTAEECRREKLAARREASAMAKWLAEALQKKPFPGKRHWELIALVAAHRAKAQVAAGNMTELCSFKAHLRGRLHMVKRRQPDGTTAPWTIEGQALLVAGVEKRYRLADETRAA